MKKSKKNELTKDLTQVKGSISFVLQNSMIEINTAYNDQNCTFEQFRDTVVRIINTAKKTAGQQKTLMSIQRQTTKDAILHLMYNTLLSGSRNAVI